MTCAHPGRFWEPLVLARQMGESGPALVAFGKVIVCANDGCRKILSEPTIDKWSKDLIVKAAVKAWTPLAWEMMREKHPFPPFAFRWHEKFIVPENYRGELKVQPEIDPEEPPF